MIIKIVPDKRGFEIWVEVDGKAVASTSAKNWEHALELATHLYQTELLKLTLL